MRLLSRNTKSFWVVDVTGSADKVDSFGNYTGEVVKTYSVPREIKLSVYPANANIVATKFGISVSADLVATSIEPILNHTSLLFLNEPSTDFFTTFDYKVTEISESLNVTNYALNRRR